MKKFIVNAKVVRGATIFQAKQDIRYYLNGVFFGKNGKVVGTNGHAAFVSSHDAKLTKDTIIQITGAIPVFADEVEFIILDNSKESLVMVRCYHSVKGMEKILGGKLIDGKYPDIDKVIPDHSEKALKKCKGINKIGLNAGYMAAAHKAIGVGQYSGMAMSFTDENSAMVCKSGNPNMPDDTLIIIMPMKI